MVLSKVQVKKGDDKFVKDVKNVIDQFVSPKLEGITTLNHYALKDDITNLSRKVENQLTTALNQKFLNDSKIPEAVKKEIRDAKETCLTNAFKNLPKITPLKAESNICKCSYYNRRTC